jgi:putative (di)nucleoside polyphosphate hydrolase
MTNLPPEYQQLPYRPCVGIMLINAQGKVFVAKRIDTTSDAWQMPQGGIDDGEDAFAAALRELGEEIGTHNASLIAQNGDWLHYDLPAHLVPKLWGGKYRGQRQLWFCLSFLGDDSEINIATAHPEFCEWQWIDIDRLPDIIVPFKRELYAKLVTEFTPHIRAHLAATSAN